MRLIALHLQLSDTNCHPWWDRKDARNGREINKKRPQIYLFTIFNKFVAQKSIPFYTYTHLTKPKQTFWLKSF